MGCLLGEFKYKEMGVLSTLLSSFFPMQKLNKMKFSPRENVQDVMSLSNGRLFIMCAYFSLFYSPTGAQTLASSKSVWNTSSRAWPTTSNEKIVSCQYFSFLLIL